MSRQSPTIFLEEWLQVNSGVSKISSKNPASLAQGIIQAWADLRDSLQQPPFRPHHIQALKTLVNSQNSLYVADPQAKLIVSILSSPDLSLPLESYPLFLRLLYIWVRKSSKHSPLTFGSVIQVLLHLFSGTFHLNKSSEFLSEGVLLLGALSFVPFAPEKSKAACLELLSKLIEEEYGLIGAFDSQVPSVLAGIGYGLSSNVETYFIRILDSLFGMWNKEAGPSGNVSHALMILHLTEWILSNFINAQSSNKIDIFRTTVFQSTKPAYASFSVLMAAAGVLRSLTRLVSCNFTELRTSAEEWIEIVAKDLVSRTSYIKGSSIDPGDSFLLHCISLALARAGSVSYRSSLLVCLASALLAEIFPLQRIYYKIMRSSLSNLIELRLDEHLKSIIFKEAGAVTRIFCNFYASADEENQHAVENLLWHYCRDVYEMHRQLALMLRGREDTLLGDLEKIAESAFLMVVVFALTVTKHRLHSGVTQEIQQELSVRILISFSCMEYFRRMRLPEYMDTIRAVVVSIQEIKSACISFVESMPSYDDLTSNTGSPNFVQKNYLWYTDDVQTARVLFYLRVIPTCIELLTVTVFRKTLAPIMFLYMGHPNGKVGRASHSMFAAFISSRKDLDQDRVKLKEELVFYYMQRSLEGYPGLTPFEGLASGVAALVRQLPAGSPSMYYCIHCLVAKAKTSCSLVNSQDPELWKSWEGELEPSKKLLDLLLQLLSLVDIQVLPSLMKQLAELVVQLPTDGQNMVLNELYQLVAESDNVTRKPTLVSWVQSLSFLCSEGAGKRILKRVEGEAYVGANKSMSSLSLNRINARL